ncbi:MAG: JAB domain-containing protein [Chloroflexi bacterium]|nr:JAB domain-containing protein [Chloroflexota bacterium]
MSGGYRIRDWDQTDRPRERLARLGPQSLTTAELLAILLRTGRPGEHAVALAQRLLREFGGLTGLHRAPLSALQAIPGMGLAKSTQIKAALELAQRLRRAQWQERPAIHSPQDVAEMLMTEMAALEQEHLRVLLLNTRNHVLDVRDVVRGSVNSAQVRVAEVFREAVRQNATAILLTHNHPSGDPTPSPDDIALTRQIVAAGETLDIAVLDHIIFGAGRYVSLREAGLVTFWDGR